MLSLLLLCARHLLIHTQASCLFLDPPPTQTAISMKVSGHLDLYHRPHSLTPPVSVTPYRYRHCFLIRSSCEASVSVNLITTSRNSCLHQVLLHCSPYLEPLFLCTDFEHWTYIHPLLHHSLPVSDLFSFYLHNILPQHLSGSWCFPIIVCGSPLPLPYYIMKE